MADDENPNEMKEEVADIAPFDPTKKKKKKKVVIQDPADDDVDKLAEKTETLSVSEGLENTFSGLKKKKKKPVQTDVLSDEKENAGDDFDDPIGEEEEGEGIILQPQFPWEGSDRDYEYEEVRAHLSFFLQPEHVMTFLLAEMGTSGSLDGQQRLVVKGRFAPKNFEGILRRYVNEYVICNGCKSPDTILSKENRLFFLRCEKCGSGRSVAPIKAGFVARVGRRKAGT
ncbi:Eukaryotic translation initiation factor 2 subunit beta like [Actinidia chinensis var. chinensis]|uniref:Eukaryotic translation initiation factor 2 subunit beta n=1 Tax=Actinidia chinensis var. chinensis TaxID=1590841 RepID=A0A2R6PPL5_ACTCC|nr:Eukaryotic translation initiation factor 2 subunit beta like [Actinidia chinensis var. chinensis]